MRRAVAMFLVPMCAAFSAGCSLAGSWKRISVDPPAVAFPLDYVTFDRSNNYTASCTCEGRMHTSTGRYNWNGFRLEILEASGRPRTYRARRRLDGKLLLTYREGTRKVTATLKKTAPLIAEDD